MLETQNCVILQVIVVIFKNACLFLCFFFFFSFLLLVLIWTIWGYNFWIYVNFHVGETLIEVGSDHPSYDFAEPLGGVRVG